MSAADDLSDITLAHCIAEAKAEIAMRERVYPKLVGDGRMRQAEATLKTRRMKKIVLVLEWLQVKQEQQRAGQTPARTGEGK